MMVLRTISRRSFGLGLRKRYAISSMYVLPNLSTFSFLKSGFLSAMKPYFPGPEQQQWEISRSSISSAQ